MTDYEIARKYVTKVELCDKNGILFTLGFTAYKNLMRAKRCGYTGIELTHKRPGKPIKGTDLTIDRIDNSIGYVSGNVIAVCHAANEFKGALENPGTLIGAKEAIAIVAAMTPQEKSQTK